MKNHEDFLRKTAKKLNPNATEEQTQKFVDNMMKLIENAEKKAERRIVKECLY